MKPVITILTFGIGALSFVAFFSTLKPTVIPVASGPRAPVQCSTKAPPSLACRSLIFATALWAQIERQN